MNEPTRIVVLGKTGAGKSSLANTIFGETVFETNSTPESRTSKCKAETRSINERSIIWVDTPGFFDTSECQSVEGRSITLIDTPGISDSDRAEKELKPEIVRCIIECAPGPHVFLIVLKVEKFTKQEQDVIKKICESFTEKAFQYAIILFTHGDQLDEGVRIEQFVNQSAGLRDLVEKCGSRCHVIDNKHWKKNNQDDEYRSNKYHVGELLKTIDRMNEANGGQHYTNDMLQEVKRDLEEVKTQISQSSPNMSPEQITEEAKTRVSQKYLLVFSTLSVGAVLAALFGVVVRLMR